VADEPVADELSAQGSGADEDEHFSADDKRQPSSTPEATHAAPSPARDGDANGGTNRAVADRSASAPAQDRGDGGAEADDDAATGSADDWQAPATGPVFDDAAASGEEEPRPEPDGPTAVADEQSGETGLDTPIAGPTSRADHGGLEQNEPAEDWDRDQAPGEWQASPFDNTLTDSGDDSPPTESTLADTFVDRLPPPPPPAPTIDLPFAPPVPPQQRRLKLRRSRRGRHRRRVRRGLRVRQRLWRVDPWSVFKISLLFYASVFLIVMVAGTLLWNVGRSSGTIDRLEGFITGLGAYGECVPEEEVPDDTDALSDSDCQEGEVRIDGFELDDGTIFRVAAIGGAILVGVGSVGNVLMVVLLNLINEVTGGLRHTIVREPVRRPPPSRSNDADVGR
jgi:hypothetical protein